jgi:hypothetical protein
MHEITAGDIKYCDFWARRFCNGWGVTLDEDNIQTAYEAMCSAAQKFDPERGIKFWTFAKYFVRAELYRKFFSGSVYNHGTYACVYRNKLQTYVGEWCVTNQRDLETEYIKFEAVQNALKTMLPVVQKGVINKALYGIDYQDTSVKLGLAKKSLGVMREQWHKNTKNSKLDRPRQKKYHGNKKRFEYVGV